MSIIEKVDDLIKLGYEDEIILMALGITNPELNNIKKQLEERKVKNRSSIKTKSKLQLLRERYERIYNNQVEEFKPKRIPLSQEQEKEIAKRLDAIEKSIPIFFEKNEAKKRITIKDIRDLYSYMENLDLTIDLAQRAYSILPAENSMYRIKDIYCIEILKRLISRYKRKCMDSINYEIDNTNDIEGLEELKRRLDPLQNILTLAYTSFQSKITQKMYTIRVSAYKDKLSISNERIEGISQSLMNPECDIEGIKETLNQIASDYYEKKKKMVEETAINETLARLQTPTIKGSIRHVIQHILNKLQEDGLNITNVDALYMNLLKIDINKSVAIHTIIEIFINNRRYSEGEEFLAKVCYNLKDRTEQTIRRTNENRIKSAKICEYIMKGINSPQGTIQDENKYYEMIKSGIEKSKIDPNLLILGTTKDGKRKITWADVMEKTKADTER